MYSNFCRITQVVDNKTVFANSALQYLILKKNEVAAADRKQKDPGVSKTWGFFENRWKLKEPKMIISVTGGKQQFFMNQRLLRSFKRGLMKAAIAAGEQRR